MPLQDEEIRFIAAMNARLQKMSAESAWRAAEYVAARARQRYLKAEPEPAILSEPEVARTLPFAGDPLMGGAGGAGGSR